MRLLSTVRAVALFEAAKGALVLWAGLGALSLLHHDAQRLAERRVGHLHLNPAKHYPRIFIDAAAHLTDARLWVLAPWPQRMGWHDLPRPVSLVSRLRSTCGLADPA